MRTQACFAPFEYLSLPLVLIAGFAIWDEFPDVLSLTGAGIIVACGILLVVKEIRNPQKKLIS